MKRLRSINGARDIRNNGADYSRACPLLMLASTASGQSQYCVPTYFLNGFEWQPQFAGGSTQDQLDAAVSPATISGIEIYLTEDVKPARFENPPSNGARCGAVVIWTR